MPYVYSHSDVTGNDVRNFSCELECRQCLAPSSSSGKQCRRNVCIWLPFCWQHTRSLLHLKIAPSAALPGSLGMYATRDFKKGDMVAPYGGEVLTPAQIKARYGEPNEYSLGPYLLYTVDSACVRFVASASNGGGFGSIPSEARNVHFDKTCHRHGANKQAGDVTVDGRVLTQPNMGIKYWSFAMKDIRAGEEIIAHYGDDNYDSAFTSRMDRCASKGVECDSTIRGRMKKKSAS